MCPGCLHLGVFTHASGLGLAWLLSGGMRGSAVIARIAVAAAAILAAALAATSAAQEDEPTLREVAQVLVNAAGTGNTTVSVTLQSTSTADIRLPDALAGRIGADDRIAYVVLTNEDSCVPGVVDESCIVVSSLRSGEWEGIDAVQAGAREIGDSYIGELNDAFGTRATFHSVYIHHSEEARLAQASDRRIVSAVYTMPHEHTASLHAKVGGIILSREIREGGGFYEASRRIVPLDGSQMLVSATPVAGATLMQVRVSAMLGGAEAGTVDPLALLPFDTLERSRVFAQGSSPLGSLVRAIVVPEEPSRVASSETALLPTVIINGELLPSAVGHAGWVFDPVSGPVIEGRFLFGGLSEVEEGELAFTTVPLDGPGDPEPEQPAPPIEPVPPASAQDAMAWLPYAGLAAAVGAGAALYAIWRRR